MQHSQPPGWIHSIGSSPSGEGDRRNQSASRPSGDGRYHNGADSDHAGSQPLPPRSPSIFVSPPRSLGDAATNAASLLMTLAVRPSRVLMVLSLITSLVTAGLSYARFSVTDRAASLIPAVVAVVALVALAVFAYQRYRFLRGLKGARSRDVLDYDAGRVTRPSDAPPTSPEQLRATAARAGETYARMRGEYQQRPKRFMPRVEAAQRALRVGMGPTYDAPWLATNLRLWLISFVVVLIGLPVCGFFTLVLLFSLLL